MEQELPQGIVRVQLRQLHGEAALFKVHPGQPDAGQASRDARHLELAAWRALHGAQYGPTLHRRRQGEPASHEAKHEQGSEEDDQGTGELHEHRRVTTGDGGAGCVGLATENWSGGS